MEKKLKICFLGWANSEHVKRWVKWFARQGYEVHLISSIYDDIPGVNVHSFLPKSATEQSEDAPKSQGKIGRFLSDLKFNYLSYLRYPGYIIKTKKLLKEIKPDILQGFYIGFSGYLGAFTGFHPFMVFTGGPDLLVFPRRSLFHRLWTKFALKKIDFLTHTSEEANAAATAFGFPAARSRFLHIGIDLQNFNPMIGTGDVKASLGIDGHPVVLSTRGLFDRYYNISGLLRAFTKVAKAMPEARLILKYYSAPEKDKFVRLAQSLGIHEKVVWAGKTSYNEMAKYYRSADVYASLSFTDSGPVSMLEAMACGCVPVVSNLKNVGEWVEDGVNGFLVEPQDSNSAAAAILKVLQSQTLRKDFGRRNAELIRQRADQEKCFREIERITLELVDKRI